MTFYGNRIKNIPLNFFAGLTEIEEVSFRKNQIEILSAIFTDNLKLKENFLKSIQPEIFDDIQLSYKYFNENPCTSDDENLQNCFDEWKRSGPSQLEFDNGKTYLNI